MHRRNIAWLLICSTSATFACLAQTSKLDGNALEQGFVAKGVGNHQSIELPARVLNVPDSQSPPTLTYNSALQWTGGPIEFRQIPGTKKFTHHVMIAAKNGNGQAVDLVSPIGPGTVYVVYGQVQILGNIITSSGTAPLVFVVHCLNSPCQTRTVTMAGDPNAPPGALATDQVVQFAAHTAPDGAGSADAYPPISLVHVSGTGDAVLWPSGKSISFSAAE
jgi:hypothetical protein